MTHIFSPLKQFFRKHTIEEKLQILILDAEKRIKHDRLSLREAEMALQIEEAKLECYQNLLRALSRGNLVARPDNKRPSRKRGNNPRNVVLPGLERSVRGVSSNDENRAFPPPLGPFPSSLL